MLVILKAPRKAGRLPVTVRYPTSQPLVAGCTPVAAGHLGGGFILIDEDELFAI